MMRPQPSLIPFLALSLVVFTTRSQSCTQSEINYLAANADLVAELSQECAFDCVLSGDQNACLIACLSAQLELSEECLSCNAEQIQCVLSECAIPCLFPNSQACENCIESNCLPEYFTCIGDADVDGYSVAGGDCDDFNPQINPGMPDLSIDGVDQNCDGVDGPVTSVHSPEDQKIQWFSWGFRSSIPVLHLAVYGADGSLLESADWNGSKEVRLTPFTGFRLVVLHLKGGRTVTRRLFGGL